ncbi:MAG: hypothetical protein ACYCV7_15385, partial [Acidimicrobiales bacterium]
MRTSIEKGGRPGAALLLCGALLVVPLATMQSGSSASASGPVNGHADPGSAPGRVRGGTYLSAWQLAFNREEPGANTAATVITVPTTVPAPTATTVPPAVDPASSAPAVDPAPIYTAPPVLQPQVAAEPASAPASTPAPEPAPAPAHTATGV